MPQKIGIGRTQMMLFCAEQQIGAENPVRVIDAFVEALDLENVGFTIKGKSKEGSPAYSANILLKLYCYGYLNRIRSSRRLEAESHRNIELWWLLEQQKPSYHTISDFRKDNSKALQKTFQAFVQMCRAWALYGAETIAIDGAKFRAQNSKKNNYNQKKITQHLQYIDHKVEDYLTELDRLDQAETQAQQAAQSNQTPENEEPTNPQDQDPHTHSSPNYQTTEEKLLQSLQNKSTQRQKYRQLQEQLDQALEKDGTRQISTTDPDARALPLKMNIVEVSYNLQTAVDDKHNLIAHYDVLNERDDHALANMAKGAKKALQSTKLKALADKGYHTGSELARCQKSGITTLVSIPKNSASLRKGKYAKEYFTYDQTSDSYTCPAGKTLTSNGNWYKRKSTGIKRKSYQVKVYKTSYHTCRDCPFAEQCAGSSNLKRSKGREIQRSEYDDFIDANRAELESNKALYRRRQAIVEHPFGTLKRGWGYTHTLLKGKERVKGEFGLILTMYNLRRVMSILGISELIKRLKARFFVIFDHFATKNIHTSSQPQLFSSYCEALCSMMSGNLLFLEGRK